MNMNPEDDDNTPRQILHGLLIVFAIGSMAAAIWALIFFFSCPCN